jgi:signal transduction histidine kinase
MTNAPGTGLGLYTASELMHAQQGSLRLTARPGGGTRVQLDLPSAPVAIGIAAQQGATLIAS